MRKMSVLVMGIAWVLMGCVSPENRDYTDPSTVTYEIEGTDEITDQTEVDQAIAVIKENLAAAQDRDIERYVATIVSEARADTRAELIPFFDTYELEHTILGIKIADQQPEQMLIKVLLQTVALNQSSTADHYRDHVSETHYTLVKEEQEWRIAESQVTENEFIKQKQ
ncbi:hypothetical protein [Dolosigranulum savutiense]|uniref:Lipoprotein n=1 Tax=Dolosigranulum savutiense TaxID=3110288 RepID=A0AB74U6T5_9LACT